MSELNTEVCIVGAGPAGATVSLFLAQKGLAHIILDAAVFPRDKVCGDGLDLKVFRVLHQLDPAITEREIFQHPAFVQAWGVDFMAPNGRKTQFIYRPRDGEPHYPQFWTAKRLHFDHFLVQRFDARYADFRPGHAVEEVRRDGAGWRVLARNGAGEAVEIKTKLLIGADGDHSVVLRSLGERAVDRDHYAGTLRQYWHGIEGLHPENLIEVYFPPGLPFSYFYIFPLPDGEANVGYGMVSAVAARKKHNLRDLFQRFIEQDPRIAPRFRQARPLEKTIGWGIPMASRRRPPSGDGYLLVGDAASLVCPTSGEGIGTGMISGYIAAQFIEKALSLRQFDAGVFAGYEREIYRRLNDEIRFYNLMRYYLPHALYDWGVGTSLFHRAMQWYFQRHAGQWLHTAFKEPINVIL